MKKPKLLCCGASFGQGEVILMYMLWEGGAELKKSQVNRGKKNHRVSEKSEKSGKEDSHLVNFLS